MIYSAFAHGDEALMWTISEVPGTGKFVKVGITEEELFRAAIGNKEFERRRAIAYEEDWGAKSPSSKPIELEPIMPMPKGRYIDLLKKAVGK